jgi:hypothetical protein
VLVSSLLRSTTVVVVVVLVSAEATCERRERFSGTEEPRGGDPLKGSLLRCEAGVPDVE